jgi:hypothetical protein
MNTCPRIPLLRRVPAYSPEDESFYPCAASQLRDGRRTHTGSNFNRFIDEFGICNQNLWELSKLDQFHGILNGRLDRVPMAGRTLRRLSVISYFDGFSGVGDHFG